ncbi:MAG TPA: VOC family protein [Thermoanaerobaculia bacterium]|nr:VOC family protein [Thermoanaerobaculia bacterium]
MTNIGTVGWIDLTVPDADAIRDFYRDIVGWTTSDVDMGGYNDYCMVVPGSEQAVAGVCHARGTNAGLPAQWLIYINVADLDQSIKSCTDRGGTILAGPKTMGEQGRYCVIRDPAGAVAALFEPK